MGIMEGIKKLEQTYRKLLSQSLKIKEKEFYEIGGIKFVIHPGVFSPKSFDSSEFLIKHLEIPEESKVLELGCGTGIISIFAARKAGKVIATDISPKAVENTKENVELHKLSSKIDVRLGDLFEPVKGEKFDRIFLNFPMGYTEKEISLLEEKQFFDYKYLALKSFLENLKSHLNSNGIAYLTFSANGSRWDLLEAFCKENDITFEVVAEEGHERDGGILRLQIVKLS